MIYHRVIRATHDDWHTAGRDQSQREEAMATKIAKTASFIEQHGGVVVAVSFTELTRAFIFYRAEAPIEGKP